MSKPKPTPAEKATLELIRAEIRSVDAQIRISTQMMHGLASLHEKAVRQLESLRGQRWDLVEKAKSFQP